MNLTPMCNKRERITTFRRYQTFQYKTKYLSLCAVLTEKKKVAETPRQGNTGKLEERTINCKKILGVV